MSTKKFSYGAWALAFAASVFLIGGCGGGTGSSSSPSTPAAIDQTQALGNIRELNLSLEQYVQDWDEKFPPAQTTQTLQPLLTPYAHDSTIFVDPNTDVPFQYNASLASTNLSLYNDYSMVVTFYVLDPPVAGARPVVVIDGRTELATDAQWQQLEATSGLPTQ